MDNVQLNKDQLFFSKWVCGGGRERKGERIDRRKEREKAREIERGGGRERKREREASKDKEGERKSCHLPMG